ncbi:MAG: pitrilysin family protein [Cyanobacteria bacterium P01_A01_bin.105]
MPSAVETRRSAHAPVIKRLPNGLTIIAEQMPTEAISLNIWLNVGSTNESDAINGMAHFLEHMIFKGTPRIRMGEFERLIEERGAVTNAATSQDYTHYYITTAPKDFAALAPLQIELLINPLLDDDAFERERPVILEEIRRSEDNPRRQTFQKSMELSFDQLPYRRPVLGPAAVIEGLAPAQMRGFHQRWYQPQNMTAVAVGNLPVEELMAVVEQGFDQALQHRQQRPELSLREMALPARTTELPFANIQRMQATDQRLQQSRLIMSWRVPGLAQLEDTFALDVAASILGQGRTARLVNDLREERKLVNGISASNITYGQQGVFYISATLAADNLAAAEAAIAAHIAQLHSEPVTPHELRRVRTQVANRYVFGGETPSDRAGLYGYYHAMTGNVQHALDYPQAIQAVDAVDIQRAVQQYLPTDAYGVLTLQPDGE